MSLHCVSFALQVATSDSSKPPFVVKPLKLGAEVLGIDLKNDVPSETVALIKQMATKHRLLVFRGQVPSRFCLAWLASTDPTTFLTHAEKKTPSTQS